MRGLASASPLVLVAADFYLSSRGFIRKFDLDRHKRSYCHISKSRNDIQARASSHPYLRETPNELSKPRPDRMKVLKTLSESPMIFGEAFDIGEDKDKDKDKVLDKDKEAKALDYQSSPLSESDYKRRSFTNNIIWPQFGLNDKVEAGAYSATRGLTQTQVPGSLGQFQTHLVKPLIRFMMMPYLRAQRTLHLARNVHVFHMQSIYVARQALHLVILLNDQVNPHTGPSDEQYKERITLEDELIHLIQDMKAWGFSQEMEERIHKIEENYVQFFRERFYFHTPRILRDDPVYQKALEYDKHTIEMRKFQQWKLGHCEVINDSQRMSLDDQQDDYSEAFIESVANSPAENVPVSSPHEHHYPRFAQNSDTDSQDTTLSPPVAVQVSNQRRRYRCIVCNSSFDRQSRADECRNNDLGIRPYECAGSWGDERCLIDGHSVATSSPSITPASHQLFTPSTPGEQFAAPPLHLPASPHQFTSLSSTFTSASPIKFVNQTTHYATVSATAHSDDPISSGPHESEDSRLRKRRRVLLTDAEDESDEKRLDDIPVKSELRPPKQAPSMWQLYFADWLQDHKARQPQNKLNIAQAAKEAGQIYKTLSAEAKEDLKKRVQQEKESRERRLAAWQRTLTPADIKRENKFRAAQRKAGLSRRANIKDPNSPKKPLSAYFLFLARIRSDPLLVDEVFGGETETTRQSVLAAQRWREMSDVEKKPFLTQAEHDKIQYDALRKVYEEKANMGSCSPARKQMTGTGYIVPQHSGTSEEPTAATMSDRSSMSESHAIMVAYEPEATISAGKTNTRATPMPMPVFSSSTRTIRQRAARKTARLPGGGDGLARSYPHAADSGAESADSDDEWVPGKSI
ncbi:hypothetical protein M408DRAFT_308571 [Serendipita vermifera MAFF 305830]|uniref:HMG box domain-containing protein n=1 Tax=Serendipita vermifera MAFF 305830 TaxID=933852 RepID=A0A0C3AJM1_SERVB|nr:hypothetical protein M408DRAFT_308571 [Serendipita vermifera MAFF 305830]